MARLITRRTALFGLGAGLTAAAGTGRTLGVPGPQPEYGGFPMGIQSYSLRHLDLDACLEATAGFGLHHIELFGAHLSVGSSAALISETLKKARRLDIAISAHGVNSFTSDHEANRRVFEMANLAGIRNLSADPANDEETFASLEKLVDEFGVRIAIHNHGPSHVWGTIEPLLQALQGLHPRIGVCADLGHFIRAGVDPIAAIRAFEGRLFGVHLKDFDAPRGDARNVIIGRGVLNLKATFAALREVGFPADGALSLEYEQRDPEEDIRECLAAASTASAD
jgi:sugar phosphate isomerase/epimerase